MAEARQDATVLWVLVSDTIADANARLVADEEMTSDLIRRIPRETLLATQWQTLKART